MIEKLPDTLIQTIAAGEIADRPVTILKELIENSLDAGATHIKIDLKDAGKTLIKITDNGSGISEKDLDNLFKKHHTSKIKTSLNEIRTFGFRGEALAATANAAKITIISKKENTESAWKIENHYGKTLEKTPNHHPVGTSVIVENLFHHLPARKKFLKSTQTELTLIKEMLKKYFIAYPTRHFTIHHNDKIIFSLPSKKNLIERLNSLLKTDLGNKGFLIQNNESNFSIQGFCSLPTENTTQQNNQFFFVNNRPLKNKIFYQAVKDAYSTTLETGHYPSVFLFLTLPEDFFDINVHPQKLDVKFSDDKKIYYFIYNAIKDNLNTKRLDASETQAERFKNFTTSTNPFENILGKSIGQLFKSYILTESDNDFYIVDQHAAHERIILEDLKKTVSSGIPKIQLAEPCLIPLEEILQNSWTTHSSLFEKIGFEGHLLRDDLCLTHVPSILPKNISYQIFLISLLEKDFHNAFYFEESFLNHIATSACKAAITANTSLSEEEQNLFLRKMEETPDIAQCNHGRPVFVKISQKDIEKLFYRQ